MAMPRRTPWYAVDVDVRKDERIADLPSDAARWGYVGAVLAEARLQTQRGMFGSRATLLEAIGRFGRFLPVYLAGGLLEEAPRLCGPCLAAFGALRPGAIVVHNWARKQNDPTHADRQQRYAIGRQPDGQPDGQPDAKVTLGGRRQRRAVNPRRPDSHTRGSHARVRARPTQTPAQARKRPDADANVTASHARAPRHVTETLSPLDTDQGVSPTARHDLAALVEQHHWRRVTKAQRAILDELAEFERLRPADVDSGYAVVATWIRETPDGEDPLQYAIACGKRRRAERQVAAGEAEQRWHRTKADDRATAPERLGAILERTNGGAVEPAPEPAAEPPEVSFDAPPPAEGASGG